jgi:pimeloyl-ACP methyl ester carboxylesterase
MKKCIISTLLFLPLMVQAQYMDYWTGKLNVGMEINIDFNVTYDGPNPSYITLDVVEQNSWDLPCELIKWSTDSFNIGFSAANVQFLGKKQNHDSLAVGVWKQNGLEIPLTLTRSWVGIEPVRPQLPNAFVDYIVEDVTILNAKDQISLYGTLTIPKGFQMKGCAILISGSGKQDKEESIMGHKPFWVIADYLTQHGYAVLRFDDRGCFRSTGNFNVSTVYDFANDVNAAIDLAKERTGLPESKMGLIGHSEGAMVAQIVLKDRPLGFFISLAGPAAPVKELMFQQNRDLREMMGIKTEEFDKTVGPFLKKVLSIAGNLSIDSTAAAKKIMKEYKKVEKKFSAAAKARFAMDNPASMGAWLGKPMRAFLSYVPEMNLSIMKLPTLALNGSVDKQVNSKANLDVYRKFLVNNPHNEAMEVVNKNHLFQSTTKGDIAEYGKIEETFSPEVLKIMLDWLNKVFPN